MSFKVDIMYVMAYVSRMLLRNHLKQHRARLDLTQEELARRVGERRQTILMIEKVRYAPSAVLAFKLASALRMKVDDLFELTSEEDRDAERDGRIADG